MIASRTTTIGELAARFPQTIPVFQERRIEFCCDGQRTLGDLCSERHLSFEELAAALGSAMAARPRRREDWYARPLSDLTAHLVEAFHEPLRQELPRLRRMAAKLGHHEPRGGHVPTLVAYELERFSAGIEAHLAVAERELFPLIARLEQGQEGDGDTARFHQLRSALGCHRLETRDALRTLRHATDGYSAPRPACATWRGLYEGLHDLDRLMQLHVHLEHNVLFPRAAALLAAARS